MYLNKPNDIVVILYESGLYEYEVTGETQVRASGIEYTDLTAKIWKEGGAAFLSHTIAIDEWKELGDGVYILNLKEAVFNTLGSMFLKLEGNLIRDFEKEVFVEYVPLHASPRPGMCVIQGNSFDIGGVGDQSQPITFKLVNVPKQINQSLVTVSVLPIYPNPNGDIVVELVRGATVLVDYPSAGIRHQITVPDSPTADLLDLLPQIP